MLSSFSMLLLVCSALACITTVEAVAANPNIIHAKQPDGSEIELRLLGDEYFHYYTDVNGFTVLEEKQSGWFRYAKHTDKYMLDIESSSLTVGQHDPVMHGLQRHVVPSIEVRAMRLATILYMSINIAYLLLAHLLQSADERLKVLD
jgi:hypothetical protein